ncbi:hypothetical protein ACFP81_03550 [Deinococcus lacus]|uniref:Uncharacterized protein n=1 Tax=Deinococcus lacus TaxID=392561 RepID=A0ABW1YAM6_9DEIO
MVTHDQREALAIASQVAVMRAGRLVQQGPPAEVFGQPRTAWTAAFLGHDNVFSQPGARPWWYRGPRCGWATEKAGRCSAAP